MRSPDHHTVLEIPENDSLIETLASIPDAQERLAWIVQRGRDQKPLPARDRVPANRVPGCVSAVWLVDRSSGGICQFAGDAEAPVLRGIVSLVCAVTNGRLAGEIAAQEADILAKLRLERHLSPTRREGIRRLQTHIRERAAQHLRDSGTP